MKVFTALLFVDLVFGSGLVIGQRKARTELSNIFERQSVDCQRVPPGPNLCERSCGRGAVFCINIRSCYNPGEGESCCSDGSICSAGSYCTDSICCPDGTPLEDCGATRTLSIILPPSLSTSVSTSTSFFTSTSFSTSETTLFSTSDYTTRFTETFESTSYYTIESSSTTTFTETSESTSSYTIESSSTTTETIEPSTPTLLPSYPIPSQNSTPIATSNSSVVAPSAPIATGGGMKLDMTVVGGLLGFFGAILLV